MTGVEENASCYFYARSERSTRMDFAAMSHAHDEDENRSIFDLVQNAVVPDSDPVRICAALELLRAVRTRIVRERLDLPVDPTKNVSR